MLAHRSSRGRALRGAMAVFVAFVAYVSVRHTYAYVIRRSAVERAHNLAGNDGRITALAAQKVLTELGARGGAKAAALAREALRSDPTAVVAASTLGLSSQAEGLSQQARRWFVYAASLSRRDLQAQLWLIEDAVPRGDVSGALHHYDIALRTSTSAPELLYPVLVAAIENPEVRRQLARTLAGRPVWGAGFLLYASGNALDLRAMAALFGDLHGRGVTVPGEAQAYAVDRLVRKGDLDLGWRYYAAIRHEKDRNRSRDPYFKMELPYPSTLDWKPVMDSEIAASLQRGERRGLFDFTGPPNIGGAMLRQTQLLSVGSYVLMGRGANIDLPEGASPYWSLACANGRELGRVTVPNSDRNGGAFSGRFVVPAGCPAQTLTLVARPVNNQTGLSGQIEALTLLPATRD